MENQQYTLKIATILWIFLNSGFLSVASSGVQLNAKKYDDNAVAYISPAELGCSANQTIGSLRGTKSEKLIRSSQHQCKFLAKKDDVETIFPVSARFRPETQGGGAVILTDQFAYIHIWKSGGTTIENLAGEQKMVSDRVIQNRDWMTFVRDPVDHFLSGWAECGYRKFKRSHYAERSLDKKFSQAIIERTYDARIRKYLDNIGNTSQATCETHSFPQANFMLDEHKKVNDKFKLIGDLSEMANVLEFVGFRNNSNIVSQRTASDNSFKAKFYPSRRDLISNVTMQEICKFIAMDYFLFDFDPPDTCTNRLDFSADERQRR